MFETVTGSTCPDASRVLLLRCSAAPSPWGVVLAPGRFGLKIKDSLPETRVGSRSTVWRSNVLGNTGGWDGTTARV